MVIYYVFNDDREYVSLVRGQYEHIYNIESIVNCKKQHMNLYTNNIILIHDSSPGRFFKLY